METDLLWLDFFLSHLMIPKCRAAEEKNRRKEERSLRKQERRREREREKRRENHVARGGNQSDNSIQSFSLVLERLRD